MPGARGGCISVAADDGLRLDAAIPGLADLDGVITLRVGVLEGATRADGAVVAEYAAANEFGVPGKIPARPALRETLDTHAQAYVDGLADALTNGMLGDGRTDPELALRALGDLVRADMVRSIRSWSTPPNSTATVLKKLARTNGRVGNAPLYETGAYVGSIGFEVTKE